MIQWKEAQADVQENLVLDFLRDFNFLDSLTIALSMQKGATLIINKSVRQTIREHASKFECEIGGLLIGKVGHAVPESQQWKFPIISIEHAVESLEFEGTGVSLQMASNVWSTAEPFMTHGRRIVGWYHSHPNLGAFFSGTDRKTQSNFFHHAYSLGYVIDPVRGDEKWFRGGNSELVPETQILETNNMN
jgi:proteasome lid subunit RPN8/RPN11